jgi:phospholipase C
MASSLAAVNHVVVLMLENRSFDHMLGYLYPGNAAPGGQPFEGLTGDESCPDGSGNRVKVYAIEPSARNAYFMPGADPGEGYMATNDQLYGAGFGPASHGQAAPMTGFVTDYAYTLGWESTTSGWPIVAGTTDSDIMGCFAPQALPVLTALAKGYAVCDQWFCSVPTQTLPNRAFLHSATSQGHMDDKTRTFTAPTIFTSLANRGQTWKVYGYDESPLTKETFTDISSAPAANFGLFADFRADAAAGRLASYSFLEPSWGSTGNSQHPNYDVALGEQLIHDVYEALRAGPSWPQTLFVLTYDEHGGCFDHVPPPWGAAAPDSSVGEFGFDFTRFGPRVPAVLVSPLIEAGTVFRAPASGAPLDHTSILKTIQQRWSLPALTARDAAAPGFGDVLTRTTPRTDDVLASVTVPVSGAVSPAAGLTSHLEQIREDLIARRSPAPSGVA